MISSSPLLSGALAKSLCCILFYSNINGSVCEYTCVCGCMRVCVCVCVKRLSDFSSVHNIALYTSPRIISLTAMHVVFGVKNYRNNVYSSKSTIYLWKWLFNSNSYVYFYNIDIIMYVYPIQLWKV